MIARLGLGTRCLLVGLILFVIMTSATVPSALYALWAADYGFGPLTITVIFSIYVAGVVFGLMGLGGWSDALGRRPMLLAAVAACAVSDVGYLFSRNLPTLIAARLVSGLATGLIAGTATATMVDLAPPHLRVRASMTALAANMGGLTAGPVVGGVFAEYCPEPLHLVYAVHLIVLALVVAVPLFAVPSRPRNREVSLRPIGLMVPPEVRADFWPAAMGGGLGFAVGGLLNTVAGLYLGHLAGIHNPFLAGLMIAPCFGVIAVGQLLSPRLPGRSRLPLCCAGLIFSCVLILAALAFTQTELLVISGPVVGVATGLAIGHGMSSINEHCPAEHRGATNSTFFAVMYVGLSVPVIGAGVAMHQIGLRAGGEIFSAVVAVVIVGIGAVLLAGLTRPVAARPSSVVIQPPLPRLPAGVRVVERV
ncbi:MAG TPA: MFS transporter [Sporichthyaceae bacterium]|jgi:MFS family permease